MMTATSSELISEQLLTWINAELREEIARRSQDQSAVSAPPAYWRRQGLTWLPFLMSSWGYWLVTLGA